MTGTVMRQEWNHLTAIHWRYSAEEVQASLPDGLTVDTFDGSAWIGLIPFKMDHIAFPFTPAIPWFGSFPETNVRTYVIDPQGRRGIWFYSLDINRLPPTIVARTLYGLPYCWGTGGVDVHPETGRVDYRLRRFWPRGGGHIKATVQIGERIPGGEVSELDHFLTARWGLGTVVRGRLLYGDVWHPRWSVHHATLESLDTDLVEQAGFSRPQGEPIVRYSPGVPVRIGDLRAADLPARR